MAKLDLKEYARRGAQARITELTQELAAIYRAFPDLRRGGAAARPAAVTSRVRRRKPMTAAQKRAVSRRMKRYWVERKANEK